MLPFSSSSFSSRCKPLSHVASSSSRLAPKKQSNFYKTEQESNEGERERAFFTPSWFQTTEARAVQHDEAQRQEPSPSP